MFDKQIERIRHHFGVQTVEDWRGVKPEWIAAMHGVGDATLNHIRMYLALRGLTLQDDETPEYWKQKLGNTRIVKALGVDELRIPVEFTILVDSMEQQPFGFDNLLADRSEWTNDIRRMVAMQEVEPSDIRLAVRTKFQALGAGRADYSIEGFEGRAHIERKSLDDAHSTILAYGERRDRFIAELEFLAGVECSAVIVECSLDQLLADVPSHGKKSVESNRKQLFRQLQAWQVDYRVPWFFYSNRRMAEIGTFRILQRFWQKQKQRKKVASVVMDPAQLAILNSI